MLNMADRQAGRALSLCQACSSCFRVAWLLLVRKVASRTRSMACAAGVQSSTRGAPEADARQTSHIWPHWGGGSAKCLHDIASQLRSGCIEQRGRSMAYADRGRPLVSTR